MSHRLAPFAKLACILAALALGASCGTDDLVQPSATAAGVDSTEPGSEVGARLADDAADSSADILYWREPDDVAALDTGSGLPDTALVCPGSLGCACGKDALCTAGVCLKGHGTALVCLDPCAQVPTLIEQCNGIDDDCDGLVDDSSCDDGNSCTVDLCAASAGCTHLALAGTCTDGEVCTVADGCSGGVCKAGPTKDCNDSEPCSQDSCVGGLGCVHLAVSGPCDDGSQCTLGELCGGGKCGNGKWLPCDDASVCTADTCIAASGCIHSSVAGPCEDGDLQCTLGDQCQSGDCKPGPAPSCDDGLVCSADKCEKGKGCTHVDTTGPCDDGSQCTGDDHCTPSGCQGGNAVVCNDINPCTLDFCDSLVGCAAVNSSLACTDGNTCTIGDICGGGGCQPGVTLACADNNPCTDDGCVAKSGCAYVDNSSKCDDGNACTSQDVCKLGICQSATSGSACDDSNPCTSDTCDAAAGCDNVFNSLPCVDGNACTSGDFCVEGKCKGGKPTSCFDGNPCTQDACAADSGCKFTADIKLLCSDGNPCSQGDNCASGVCLGVSALNCNDNNPCTADGCSASAGCTHVATTTTCSDGNPCTAGDTCKGGQCQPGKALNCADTNPCTVDTCTANAGCAYSPASGACTDGSACTSGETCTGGQCTGGVGVVCADGNPCTVDTCVSTTGCSFVKSAAPCSDNNACTTGDFCEVGTCKASGTTPCNDSNPCTDDACLPQLGCTHKANSVPCSDGSICTLGDVCAAGSCVLGKVLLCNDGNPCTNDGCDPLKGCVAQNNAVSCDDNDACTSFDGCAGGACTGKAVNCQDNTPCTTDICSKQQGCLHIANAQVCDDNSLCTSGDVCKNGACVGGLVNCDDKNPCTVDTCTSKSGCIHGALPEDSVCGVSGVCQKGLCSAGSDVNPALSCAQILKQRPKALTGVYFLDPDQGEPTNKYKVLCDMVSHGGGWLRLDNGWANTLLVMTNPSPTQGKCLFSATELRAWDGFDGAPGYGHLCMAVRPTGNWMAYSELRLEGITLTGYTAGKGNTYDLSFDCYGLKSKGAFCAGPNDNLQPVYNAQKSLGNGDKMGPTTKLIALGKVWQDFQLRAREEGPQLEGIVWNSGVFLLR